MLSFSIKKTKPIQGQLDPTPPPNNSYDYFSVKEEESEESPTSLFLNYFYFTQLFLTRW